MNGYTTMNRKLYPTVIKLAWQGVACLEHHFLQIWDTLLGDYIIHTYH